MTSVTKRDWVWEYSSLAAIALAGLAAGVTAQIITTNAIPDGPGAPIASAFVRIDSDAGHGSATHIGDGLFVTAAHVLGDGLSINGAPVEVLWSNEAYDVAVIRGQDQLSSVPLSCRALLVGDTGQPHGNPMDIADITTTLVVAGEAREIGPWKIAMPMDGSIGPGMSGGGFVIGGALVGVNVGLATAPASSFSTSFYGISIVVPSTVVCDLMGRV